MQMMFEKSHPAKLTLCLISNNISKSHWFLGNVLRETAVKLPVASGIRIVFPVARRKTIPAHRLTIVYVSLNACTSPKMLCVGLNM